MFKTTAPKLLADVPFVGSFLAGVGQAVLAGPELGGSSVQGVYGGLARVVLGLAEKQGLCFVIEDLHAADEDTLYFLNYLLHRTGSAHIFLLATIQEEQLGGGTLGDLLAQWTARGATAVTVGPLSRDALGDVVRALSAGRRPSQRTIDHIFHLTGGNPFFVGEMLKLLDEEAAHVDDVPTEQAVFALPQRVSAVLQRRLQRVDTETRGFLEAAAVALQTTQELELIGHVLEVETRLAVRLLNQAIQQRFMVEGPQGEVRFVHDLMRRAVLTGMGDAYRRFLDGRAGEWLDRAGRFTPAAFHYERSGRIPDMVRAPLQAATVAEHAGMYRTALSLLGKLEAHMDELDLGPRLVKAHLVLGQWNEAEERLTRLPREDAEVRWLWSDLHHVRGDFRSAAQELEQAVRGGAERHLDALIRIADAHLYLAEFDDAARVAREALDEAERTGAVHSQARCLGILGATEFFKANVDEALRRFSRAYELLRAVPEEQRNRTTFTIILHNLGQVSDLRGDHEAARRYHSQSLELRRAVSDVRGVLHSLH